ncbi:MAG: hypothetical protein KTV77_04690 [Wolbachia endosymbiont of Fragariocoptes setiger]|nr:hypothetical protein [Wolbachia endosymbiont of Fragariocoptes setiger]
MEDESILSQYEKKFVSISQSILLDAIRNYSNENSKLSKLYKKIFNRDTHIESNDLLASKERFSEKFEFNNEGAKISQLLKNLMIETHTGDTLFFDRQSKSTKKFIKFLKEKRTNKTETVDNLKSDINQVQQSYASLVEKFKEFYSLEKTLNIKDLVQKTNRNAYIMIILKSNSSEQAEHSLLIRQNSNNTFSFYDPNRGAVFDLTKKITQPHR